MALDEQTVRGTVDLLNEKGLAGAISMAESRVTKFEHRVQEKYEFRPWGNRAAV